VWHAASRLRKRRSVDALTGTSHRRDRRVETSVSIPSSRAAAAGRGYRRRRPRVGASMTARYSPRSALAERFTCSPRPRRRSQCARERYADDSPSACQTARAATPNLCGDGAKTTKYPTGACFVTSPDVTRTSVACDVKLYLAVPSPRSSRCLPARPITSPSSVLRPVSFRARHRTALRSGLRSETSSIIGLAQGRVPNTGLRWPGPSFGTSDAHRDGRPQVPR